MKEQIFNLNLKANFFKQLEIKFFDIMSVNCIGKKTISLWSVNGIDIAKRIFKMLHEIRKFYFKISRSCTSCS